MQKLTPFVVMPLEIELCFNLWWKDLPDDHEVVVRYPHERHGLAGKVSNHAKTDTKERFLEFVYHNSQPNGWMLDSRNPTHFFLPNFTTKSAPIFFAVSNFLSSLSIQIIFAFEIAFAICIAINPNPPAPIINRYSGEFAIAFLTALYAVNPEQANEVAESIFTPFSFAKYFEFGIKA